MRTLPRADVESRPADRSAPLLLRRRMRRLRRRFRHWRRRVRYSRSAPWIRRALLYGVGGVVALSLLWLLVTGLLAKQALGKLETRLVQVRALIANGDVVHARAVAKDIPVLSARAHRLTSGPVWWTAAQVPYLGEPLAVARGTVAAADDVGSRAIPQLMDVATLVDPATLRVDGDTIRLAPLVQAAVPLQRAAVVVDAAERRTQALPASTWLSPMDGRRARFLAELQVVRGYVDAAARAARVLPTMLGQHGTQRYFIGLQNEAELRGTGGLPGAFAIATTHDGTISFRQFESDAALEPPTKDHVIRTGLSFGRQYTALYGASAPTTTFVDSNVSPHFPYAAQIWAAMWRRTSGQRVDGVIAVDPTVLSYFLAATGPATLPGGGELTSANVVSLTEKDQYAMFSDNAARKRFEVAILKATARRLTSGAGSAVALLQAATRAAGEQRLLTWSADAPIEAELRRTGYAGALPAHSDQPFSGLVLNNASSGKVDYYLARTLTYQRTGCGGSRDVTVTITLTNNAPASGLPPYVATRLDANPPPTARPGDSRMLLDYYATRGALLESVTLNGRTATASATSVDRLSVFRMDLELPRGTTQTIVLHLSEPAGRGVPRIWKQPGVQPLAVQVYDEKCG